MMLSTKLIAGGLAGMALALSAGAALAAPAQATGSVNVRSGPGTSYAIRDTLYAGEDVDVQRCAGSWCYIVHSGPDGWVSANYLSGGGYDEPVYAPPPVYVQPAPIYVNPPPIFVRPPVHHRPPFHHRPPHSGTPPHFPPGAGNHPHFPPGNGHHPHFPPTGGTPPHRPPPGIHVPHQPGTGGGNFCATHASAPMCSGGGGGAKP